MPTEEEFELFEEFENSVRSLKENFYCTMNPNPNSGHPFQPSEEIKKVMIEFIELEMSSSK